jgi:hypothetical protein
VKIKAIHPQNLGWYEIKLDEVHMKHLWDCIKNPVSNHKPKLAGNISKSQLIVDKNNFFFDKVLLPACHRYVNDFKTLPVKQLPVSERHAIYLSTMWVNYQKQTEFNPRHNHTGIYSFVVWMKIPTNFEDQRKLKIAESTSNFISNFCFDYKNMLGHETGSVYKMSPEMEGFMLFFPSELNHAVYPFYNCDEERISVSGNLMLDTRVCV